ncbi:hypothetical protein KIN20_008981 [Parelaphostrongylus tenuis]|uniref:Uncharacterized protein n=1 Tax=Parelaphostrongylus tenuis TaxID=148309 RepID=A0AAD5MR58_PARTN|nr:hypothetical protein KIN20_008981 [Parelaphostrongylus tenuis]
MSQVKNSLDESKGVFAPPKVPNGQVVASPEVIKKERVKRQKDVKEETVVLKNKHSESVDDEVSVAREIYKVRKALKRAWKDVAYIDCYKFVMDPPDLGMTIQNVFLYQLALN